MTVHIEDLKFQCIIGILDFERKTPQEIIINFSCEYNYYEYYENKYLNYVDLVEMFKRTMIDNKFNLLEDAILSLKSEIIKNFPFIKSYSLKITKPHIIEDCKVSISDKIIFNS